MRLVVFFFLFFAIGSSSLGRGRKERGMKREEKEEENDGKNGKE